MRSLSLRTSSNTNLEGRPKKQISRERDARGTVNTPGPLKRYLSFSLVHSRANRRDNDRIRSDQADDCLRSYRSLRFETLALISRTYIRADFSPQSRASRDRALTPDRRRFSAAVNYCQHSCRVYAASRSDRSFVVQSPERSSKRNKKKKNSREIVEKIASALPNGYLQKSLLQDSMSYRS